MQPKIHPCPATGCTYTFTSKKGVREHVKREYDHLLVVIDYMENPSKYPNGLLVPTEGRHCGKYANAHLMAWRAYNKPKPPKAERQKIAAKKYRESHQEETQNRVKLSKLRAKVRRLELGEKETEEEAQRQFEEWKKEKNGKN